MKSFEERTDAVLAKAKLKERRRTFENKKLIKTICALTASAVALVAINLTLFLPYPENKADLSAYKKSEYYGLMNVVNDITATPPEYKNNFEKVKEAISGIFAPKKGMAGDNSARPNAPSLGFDGAGASQNEQYVENTNNQVAGVTEGDLLKRSKTHAFYIMYNSHSVCIDLTSVSINGEDSDAVSTLRIATERSCTFNYRYFEDAELYLSEDCKTVTVISSIYNHNVQQVQTRIVTVDVSDPADMKEVSHRFVSGSFISSRTVNGELLVFTNMAVYGNPDFSHESNFLPQTGALDNLHSLPAENIVYNSKATSARYTIVSKFADGEIADSVALLSYSTETYVSLENIYLTREYTTDGCEYTDISRVEYTGGLEYKNTYTVEGSILNQYSMDEYDGYFRAVTTVNSPAKNASLYIFDIQTGETAGSLERFAPDGESVRSVRFDKNIAYVCTAIKIEYVITDPVFIIDISDPANIQKPKDTGTIAGFSSTLIKFKHGLLLGIGSGESSVNSRGWEFSPMANYLKLELYAETETGVESVAKLEYECTYSTEFKSYYIDAERGLVGIPVNAYNEEKRILEDYYLICLFDGVEFVVINKVPMENIIDSSNARAFYEDGDIYIVYGIYTGDYSGARVQVINFE